MDVFILDMGTLVVARIISIVVFALGITVMTLQRSRRETVLFCWSLFCAVMSWVMALSSYAANQSWSMVLYAGFVTASVSLQWAALARLTNRPVTTPWFWVPPVVAMAAVLLLGTDLKHAALFTSTVQAAQLAALAGFILTMGSSVVSTRTSVLMAGAYILSFGSALTRVLMELFWPEMIANPMAPVPAVTVPFLASYLATILTTLAWVAALKDRAEDALTNLAFRDELTGLANRRRFLAIGSVLMARAKKEGAAFSILLLDIDYFKSVNDRFGHEEGDRVLAGLGKAIGKLVPKPDIAARVGGEEFCLVFVGCDAREAHRRSEMLRDILEHELTLPEGSPVRFSAGVAQSSPQDYSLPDLYRRADKALYEAKASGRDCAVISTPAPPFAA